MTTMPINELPEEINTTAVVETCYSPFIDRILDSAAGAQSVLVECDKLVVNDLLAALRRRNKNRQDPLPIEIVDHRAGEAGATTDTAAALTRGVKALSERVALEDCRSCAMVVPNFDLLASSDQTNTHLDLAARDLMAVLYENPDLILIAFKDPCLNLPRPVLAFFPRQIEIFGVDRAFMPSLITRAEARRIDTRTFDPYQLYKYVSGQNVVRLRKILMGFTSPQYVDGGGAAVLNEIRKATLSDAEAELPSVPMSMIGGYEHVKRTLREDVLGLLRFIREEAATEDIRQIKRYERLIPRNILFTGPPGTGKTLFCKALATELDATIFIVNGPELKSKWVGESERAIRNIFSRARKCAPSLIVFDEIDSFTRQRPLGGETSYTEGPGRASASDHSMLNQLLTEMDGFRPEEMVFVVATTNAASSLDTALLSRFILQIDIPYPEAADRRAIMKVYDRMYGLNLSEGVMEALIRETELWIDQDHWTRFAGRDLEALASSLARYRLVEGFRAGKGRDDIGITRALVIKEVHKKIKTLPVSITFHDIGGYEEVKERLQTEILDVLTASRALPADERAQVERLIPKGVIFEGPPGVGKTMFARALANALDATVSVVRGPELKGGFVGQTEERIRRVFEEARRNAPSVIVFDELDSMASEREGPLAGGVERSVVNQLLTEMDGLNERGLVFVAATTNFARALDKALKRPGRFEFVIHIPYPDEAARRKIFEIYNQKYDLGLDNDVMEHLVFRTDNWVDPEAGIRFSGDHVEAVCRGIARRKMMDAEWRPTGDNVDRVVSQRTGKPLDVSLEEEVVIATHEAGHAIVSRRIKGCRPIKRISIASEYDGSLGYVLHEDMPNKYVHNQDEVLAEICCLMGGRMAEKKLLGRIATGGANDIEKATLMATHLVAGFGMDEDVGPRLVPHPLIHGPRAAGSASPELLGKVEKGVNAILREQEEKALKCIEEHWEEYNKLRDELMQNKVIEFREE